MQVKNFDVAGVVDRLARYASELVVSQSASNAEFNEHDRGRATKYLDRLTAYMDAVNTPANPLDLPKTHPTDYPVKDFTPDEAVNAIENAEVRDLVRRLKAAYTELSESQSRDRVSGFLVTDHDRIKALVENARNIVALGVNTEDLPEQIDGPPPVS